MKSLIICVFFAAVFFTGCAGKSAPPVSTDQQYLVVGEKPSGYPKSRSGIENGVCYTITEDWREIDYDGHSVWLKVREIFEIGC